MTSNLNYYDLLGIPKDATPDEVRRAYREAAQRLHPDVRREQLGTEMFIQAQKAYEVLADPKARSLYDQSLSEQNDDPVILEVTYSRPSLAVMNDQQLIYALLEFSPAAKYSLTPDPPLNLCLVLDHSTSMQGARLDTVKTAAVELVRQLRPEDRLSLVLFSDRAEVLLPAGKRIDRSLIETQIQMIRASGGTEIFQGLQAGFDEVKMSSTRSMINHIILITDGRTYGDEEQCLQLADTAGAQGIRITGLGIGTEWNDAFLDELTRRTGGTSLYVSRANDIRSFLQEKFTGLKQLYGERVAIDLTLSPGVKLNSVYRLQPESAVMATTFPIRLGGIPKQAKLSVLLELVIPEVSMSVNRFGIAAGEFTFVLPFEPARQYKIPIYLSRLTSTEMNVGPPPKSIFQALSQITLFRMQERARQEVAEGKVQDASLRLQRLATQLLSMGEIELAQTAIIEAERIQQTHMLSAEGEKRIKYGTRSFLLPARAQE